MHAYIHTCIYTYIHTCIYTYIYTCIHVYVYFIYMYMCVCICICIDLDTCTCIDIDIHRYRYIYTYTYILIHIEWVSPLRWCGCGMNGGVNERGSQSTNHSRFSRATHGQRGATSQHRFKEQQTLHHEVTQADVGNPGFVIQCHPLDSVNS